MTTESKYAIKGQIIQMMWGSFDGDNPTVFDASLLINIKDNNYLCFYAIDEFPITKQWIDSKIGKDVLFTLGFLDFGINTIEPTTPEITSIPIEHSPNRYVLIGKIIEIQRHDNLESELKHDLIIVDCGMPVSLCAKIGLYKIEDYIKTEGRLDIKFLNID